MMSCGLWTGRYTEIQRKKEAMRQILAWKTAGVLKMCIFTWMMSLAWRGETGREAISLPKSVRSSFTEMAPIAIKHCIALWRPSLSGGEGYGKLMTCNRTATLTSWTRACIESALNSTWWGKLNCDSDCQSPMESIGDRLASVQRIFLVWLWCLSCMLQSKSQDILLSARWELHGFVKGRWPRTWL